MTHSPGRVLAELLIDAGFFTAPSDGSEWPIYNASMPDLAGTVEDTCACAYDTGGLRRARHLADGANVMRYSAMIQVRAADYEEGWEKITDVQDHLATVHNVDVEIDSVAYTVETVSQEGAPTALGAEPGTKRRELFSLNVLMYLV